MEDYNKKHLPLTYKIIMSRGDDIPVDNVDDLKNILLVMDKNGIAITKHGVVNKSYFVSVVVDKERNHELYEDIVTYGQKYMDPPSEFAALLKERMPELPKQNILNLNLNN